jgi:hypothetical protein
VFSFISGVRVKFGINIDSVIESGGGVKGKLVIENTS